MKFFLVINLQITYGIDILSVAKTHLVLFEAMPHMLFSFQGEIGVKGFPGMPGPDGQKVSTLLLLKRSF